MVYVLYICYLVSHFLVYVFKGVNVCVYVGEGLRRSFATPDPFVLTNKICLNQKEIFLIEDVRATLTFYEYALGTEKRSVRKI